MTHALASQRDKVHKNSILAIFVWLCRGILLIHITFNTRNDSAIISLGKGIKLFGRCSDIAYVLSLVVV